MNATRLLCGALVASALLMAGCLGSRVSVVSDEREPKAPVGVKQVLEAVRIDWRMEGHRPTAFVLAFQVPETRNPHCVVDRSIDVAVGGSNAFLYTEYQFSSLAGIRGVAEIVYAEETFSVHAPGGVIDSRSSNRSSGRVAGNHSFSIDGTGMTKLEILGAIAPSPLGAFPSSLTISVVCRGGLVPLGVQTASQASLFSSPSMTGGAGVEAFGNTVSVFDKKSENLQTPGATLRINASGTGFLVATTPKGVQPIRNTGLGSGQLVTILSEGPGNYGVDVLGFRGHVFGGLIGFGDLSPFPPHALTYPEA